MINAYYFAKSASRTSPLTLPSIFRRHKSITAAIERGRNSTSGRRFGNLPSSKPFENRLRSGGSNDRKFTRKPQDYTHQLHELSESGKASEAWRGSRQDRGGRPTRQQREETGRRREHKTSQDEDDTDAWDKALRDQPDHGRRARPEGPRRNADPWRAARQERDAERRTGQQSREDFFRNGLRRQGERDGGDWKAIRADSDSGRATFEGNRRPRDTETRTDKWRDTREGSERKEDTFRGKRSDIDTGRPTSERLRRFNDREERPSSWNGNRQDSNSSYQSRDRPQRFQDRNSNNRFQDRNSTDRTPPTPESLPYTTAASTFLYGYTAILAAIKAQTRQLYNLYIHNERGMKHEGRIALIVRARQAGVKIHEVDDTYLPLLDKASSGRPHNGFILEASPLPRPPITSLTTSSIDGGYFTAPLDKQSREDIAINGTKSQFEYNSGGWRHPFLLYVDGVLDEGNLGNIIRSAYFLGVDGMVMPTRNCAPMSHVTLKASAGAAEALPLFTVADSASFLQNSARAGWRIYASDAVPHVTKPTSAVSPSSSSTSDSSSNITFSYAQSTRYLQDHAPLTQHPTILMMGGEGSGLSSSLVNHAHYKVGIRAARNVDEVGVDSLNVSVAAGMLCFEILKRREVRRDLLF